MIRVPRAINVAAQDGGPPVAMSSKYVDIDRSYAADSPSAGPSRISHSARASSPIKGHRDVSHAKAGVDGQGHDERSNFEYSAQATSTAEWNSLLVWARRQRGPQWDSATAMWQVDQGSTEYYSFANDPARHTKLSRAANRPVLDPNGTAVGSEGNPYLLAAGSHVGDTSFGGPPSGDALNRGGRHEDSSPPLGPGMRRSRMR